MKLAEALMERAAMQKRLGELRDRIAETTKTGEGQAPPEDSEPLLREAMGIMDDVGALMVRINRSNNVAKLDDGRPLAEAITERDSIIAKQKLLRDAAISTRRPDNRWGHLAREQIVVDVKKLYKQADDLGERARKLNMRIQLVNWSFDLVD